MKDVKRSEYEYDVNTSTILSSPTRDAASSFIANNPSRISSFILNMALVKTTTSFEMIATNIIYRSFLLSAVILEALNSWPTSLGACCYNDITNSLTADHIR